MPPLGQAQWWVENAEQHGFLAVNHDTTGASPVVLVAKCATSKSVSGEQTAVLGGSALADRSEIPW